jgi:hypothetical protein
MKKILTAAAALLFSVAMFAQSNDSPPPAGGNGQNMKARTPMTPEQRAKRETDRINSMASLGDAYQKVMDVNKQDEIKKESITNGTQRDSYTEDQKAQLRTLNDTHKANLKTAMGADLYAKYEAAKKARSEERKNQGGGHPGE